MKSKIKSPCIIALIAITGLSMIACFPGTEEKCPPHDWSGITVTAPTCVDDGYTTQTCLLCSETKQIYQISAPGHNWSGITVTAPTCADKGYTTRTCLRCSKILTGPAIEYGHTWGDDAVTAPTCRDEGYTTQTCSRCFETQQIKPTPVNGLNHVWGNFVVTEPKCEEFGYTTQTCLRCSETGRVNYVSMLGHTWDWTEHTPGSGLLQCQAADCTATAGVGITGPAGGKIFYVSASGFTVSDEESFTAYYLEAALLDVGSYAWASSSYLLRAVPGTGTIIGTGKANTAAILAFDADAPAARAIKNYRQGTGGKDDWFLPSKDELNELYKQRNYLSISSGFFWSSSQEEDALGFSVWRQDFKNGNQYYTGVNTKSNAYNVRAVRAF